MPPKDDLPVAICSVCRGSFCALYRRPPNGDGTVHSIFCRYCFYDSYGYFPDEATHRLLRKTSEYRLEGSSVKRVEPAWFDRTTGKVFTPMPVTPIGSGAIDFYVPSAELREKWREHRRATTTSWVETDDLEHENDDDRHTVAAAAANNGNNNPSQGIHQERQYPRIFEDGLQYSVLLRRSAFVVQSGNGESSAGDGGKKLSSGAAAAASLPGGKKTKAAAATGAAVVLLPKTEVHFCCIQLLEIAPSFYCLFERKGVIGQKGDVEYKTFPSLGRAVVAFERAFSARTGNEWNVVAANVLEFEDKSTAPSATAAAATVAAAAKNDAASPSSKTASTKKQPQNSKGEKKPLEEPAVLYFTLNCDVAGLKRKRDEAIAAIQVKIEKSVFEKQISERAAIQENEQRARLPLLMEFSRRSQQLLEFAEEKKRKQQQQQQQRADELLREQQRAPKPIPQEQQLPDSPPPAARTIIASSFLSSSASAEIMFLSGCAGCGVVLATALWFAMQKGKAH